jgi:hypothetical protein
MTEHQSDLEQMADAMLDLAEQAIRTCIDAGLGPQIEARASRLLPAARPKAAQLDDSRQKHFDEMPGGPLTLPELARVLNCLKVQRSARLTPNENAANMLARADVGRAMRAGLTQQALAQYDQEVAA